MSITQALAPLAAVVMKPRAPQPEAAPPAAAVAAPIESAPDAPAPGALPNRQQIDPSQIIAVPAGQPIPADAGEQISAADVAAMTGAGAPAAAADASMGAMIGSKVAAAQNKSVMAYHTIGQTMNVLTQNLQGVGQMAKGYWQMLRGN